MEGGEEMADGPDLEGLEGEVRTLTKSAAVIHRLYRKARCHLLAIVDYHGRTGRMHRAAYGMAFGGGRVLGVDPTVRSTLWRQVWS